MCVINNLRSYHLLDVLRPGGMKMAGLESMAMVVEEVKPVEKPVDREKVLIFRIYFAMFLFYSYFVLVSLVPLKICSFCYTT